MEIRTRDYKNLSAQPYSSNDKSKFKVHVTAVDQNETIDDMQDTGRLSFLVPEKYDRRGYFVSGLRMDGQSTMLLDILVPPRFPGEFQMPQIGDVIWVGVNETGKNSGYVYLHGDYAESEEFTHDTEFPAPYWGSMPGDHGYLRSYKDHTMQFSRKPDDHYWHRLPKNKPTFITKWVRSITGQRWKTTNWYEDWPLVKEQFSNRGDNVFDIDPENMSKEVVEENGVRWLSLPTRQYEYPYPMNVPEKREKREDFKYKYTKYKFAKKKPKKDEFSPFKPGKFVPQEYEYEEFYYKNDHFFAYEPILDKPYKKKTSSSKWKGFERELPVREEYQVSLRGNSKLLIQDVHGDGEQLVILLKNHYDSGIAIIQDKEKSQVRIRDHVGQSVLLEGNKDNPRIIAMTRERQRVEMGSEKDKGSFLYVRNGPAYDDAKVPWGRFTHKTIDTVFNQELVFTSSKEIANSDTVLERLSKGMAKLVAKPGAGMYLRMAPSHGAWEKTYESWEQNDKDLYENYKQEHTGSYTETHAEVLNNGMSVEWWSKGVLKGSTLAFYKFNNEMLHYRKNVPFSEMLQGEEIISASGIMVNTPLHWHLNAGSASSSVPIIGSGPF